jgi:nitrogen regulatory protein P-II 1
MKKIEAIIRPHKLDDVHTALEEAGFAGISVSEVRGYGRQKGHKEIYRGTEYFLQFVPKVKIDLICTDSMKDIAVDVIIKHSKTGELGDGKIFISTIEESIRIRTEESGEQAL